LLAVLALFSSAAAQDSTTSNSLKEGMWALQFQVGDNFTLTSFQGSIGSIKRHLSNNSAIRVGVSTEFNTQDNELATRRLTVDTLQQSQAINYNTQVINFRAQYLFYPSPQSEVNLFIGTGPTFYFGHSKNESGSNSTSSSSVTSRLTKIEEYFWSIGVSAVLGVEWFATRSISFHAEYSTFLDYVSTKSTRIDEGSNIETRQTKHEFRKLPGRAYLGLSAYF
jgi:hypothetical protein